MFTADTGIKRENIRKKKTAAVFICSLSIRLGSGNFILLFTDVMVSSSRIFFL